MERDLFLCVVHSLRTLRTSADFAFRFKAGENSIDPDCSVILSWAKQTEFSHKEDAYFINFVGHAFALAFNTLGKGRGFIDFKTCNLDRVEARAYAEWSQT
jgi:hypothetical protein